MVADLCQLADIVGQGIRVLYSEHVRGWSQTEHSGALTHGQLLFEADGHQRSRCGSVATGAHWAS